jgi:hypothetical protein
MLRLLSERAAAALSVMTEFETIREASMARVEAANALKRLTDHPQDGGFGLKDDDPRVIAATKALDKDTREFELIKQRSEDRTAAWHAASGVLANTEPWLKSGRPGGTRLEQCDWPEPKLAKGENGLLDAVENRRRRVRELHADLHRIRSAPYPSSHAKQRMRAQIEALAQRGAPDVTNLIEHDGEIIWPTLRLQVDLFSEPGAVAFVEIPDTVGMNAWRHKSEWMAALDAEINTEADDPAALTHEARQKAEAEVMSDLLATEREEASLTWSAMEQRLPVEFRPDISPLALLGLKLVTTPRADALPETSPGLSWPMRR